MCFLEYLSFQEQCSFCSGLRKTGRQEDGVTVAHVQPLNIDIYWSISNSVSNEFLKTTVQTEICGTIIGILLALKGFLAPCVQRSWNPVWLSNDVRRVWSCDCHMQVRSKTAALLVCYITLRPLQCFGCSSMFQHAI